MLTPSYKLILDLKETQTITDLQKEITRMLRMQLGEQCTIATPDELIVLEMQKRLKGNLELSRLVNGYDENHPLLVVLPNLSST